VEGSFNKERFLNFLKDLSKLPTSRLLVSTLAVPISSMLSSDPLMDRHSRLQALTGTLHILGTSASPLTVYISESPPIPTNTTDSIELTLMNTSVDVDLSLYFEDATTYTVVTNPVNNTTLVAQTLSLQGAFRNTVYTVQVSASNIAGTSITNLSIIVTETPAVPTLTGSTSSLTLATLTSSTAVLTDMAPYWTNATSYMLSANPQNSASLSGTILRITGAYRSISYAVTLRPLKNVTPTLIRGHVFS
jgi:hypothetical protein